MGAATSPWPDEAFRLAVESWLVRYGSEHTRLAYRGDLAMFGAWCQARGRQPLGAGPADVEAFRASHEAAGSSAASIARRTSAIAGFLRSGDAADANLTAATDPDPDTNTGGTSPTLALAPQETAMLLGAFGRFGTTTDVLVALLLLDGLKLAEVLRLDTDDIAGRGPAMTASVPRHGRPQAVAISATTAGVVRTHLRHRPPGPLLTGEGVSAPPGRRLTRSGADFLLKRMARGVGLRAPLTANRLRRTYVTAAHDAGTAVDDIRHHLGQRDVRTTRRYLSPPRRPDPQTTTSPAPAHAGDTVTGGASHVHDAAI